MRFPYLSVPILATGSLAQVSTIPFTATVSTGANAPVIETLISTAGQETFTATISTVPDNSLTATVNVAQNSLTATASVGSGVDPPFPSAAGIVQVASASDQLSTLLSVLQEDRFSDLLERIAGGIFTCLAPTNDAFAAFLETENGQRFQVDDEYAMALLNYHIMLGIIEASAFSSEGLVGSEWYRTWYYEPTAQPDVDARVGGYTDENGVVQIVSGYLSTATVAQAVSITYFAARPWLRPTG